MKILPGRYENSTRQLATGEKVPLAREAPCVGRLLAIFDIPQKPSRELGCDAFFFGKHGARFSYAVPQAAEQKRPAD